MLLVVVHVVDVVKLEFVDNELTLVVVDSPIAAITVLDVLVAMLDLLLVLEANIVVSEFAEAIDVSIAELLEMIEVVVVELL